MNTDLCKTGEGEGPVARETRLRLGPVLGRVVFFWLVFGLLVLSAGKLAGFAPRAWQGFVCGVIGSIGTLGFTWWLLRRDGLGMQDAGLAWRHGSVGRFMVGVFIGVGLFAGMAVINATFGGVRWVRSPEVGLTAVLVSALTFLALGCLEELGFRGYPLRMLERPMSLWGAQILVAAMFGFSHYIQGWPLLPALLGTGLGSLVFGMAAIATRGLAAPIGIHAAGNLIDWMLGGKGPSGLWKIVITEESRSHSQLVSTLGYCLVMTAATAGFWLWQRRQKRSGGFAEFRIDSGVR